MQLKILSWNIWCGTHLDQVVDFLKNRDYDIIALQEGCIDTRGNIIETIAGGLGYQYAHAVDMNLPVRFIPGYAPDDMRMIKFGPAILSKHKIVKSNVIKLTEEDNKLIITADIEIEGKILHIYSVHLNHTHQTQSDLQDLQAKNLVELAKGENTMVMGDFNSLPESSVIKILESSLADSEIGPATPTWSVYRDGCTVCLIDEVKHKLDYIFTSKDMKVHKFTVHDSKASDHLPISVVVEF